MNINSRTVSMTVLIVAAASAGSYTLLSGNRDAVTAQVATTPQTGAASGQSQPKKALAAAPSSSQDISTAARVSELSRQIVKLKKQRDSKTQPADNRIDQLDLEIEKLWTEFAYLTGEFQARTDTEMPFPDDEDLSLNIQDDEEKAIREIEEELAFFDEVGTKEGSDESWAADAEAKLYESFEGISEQGISVGDVVCHSTFCKADLSIASESPNEAMSYLQEVAPWAGESVMWIKDLDQGIGVMYVAREGDSLPQFE